MTPIRRFSLMAALLATTPLAWAQATSGMATDPAGARPDLPPATQMQATPPEDSPRTLPAPAEPSVPATPAAPATPAVTTPPQVQPARDPLVERRAQRREARQEYRDTKKAAKAERKAARKAADTQAEGALRQ